MTRQLKVMLALALMCGATTANAGVFQIVPSIAGWLDESFNPVAPPLPLTNPGIPYVVQVDIDVVVDALAPGEDSFGNAGFNIALTGPIADFGDLGWQANNPIVDSNGSLPLGNVSLYAQNGDFGSLSTDEQGILVSMATGAFTNANDPRRRVGEVGGIRGLMGTLFMRWDGTDFATLTIDGAQVSAKLTGGAFQDSNQIVIPGLLAFGNPVPEPSSVLLLGSCVAGMILRRRAA
jgi:hypothetical protein